MVFGMSDEYVDPSGNTQAFRAFANSPEPEPAAIAPESASKLPLMIGIAVAAVVVIALVAWLALS
jgi:hypothetical protein